MGNIDLDKFIESLLKSIDGKPIRSLTPAIAKAIKEQGLTYKDGKIVEIEPKQESSELEVEQNWRDLRNQAAIAAMQGVMNFFGSIDYNRETIARLAVEQADALIAELRKEK